ncbi:MAG TPA: hypothetical protein VEI52_08485 [Terriglobales bacterium]|nr:hypothetical protein [Terriglobales bacterium]
MPALRIVEAESPTVFRKRNIPRRDIDQTSSRGRAIDAIQATHNAEETPRKVLSRSAGGITCSSQVFSMSW